ncbi:MAG: transcriptional regulator [Sandaracinus sp.]|nr:transcriptional regulator [Sandaracinus sp.]
MVNDGPTTPNLDFLRTFVVFAEEGGFAAAARRLHLSQAAIHAQVRKLGESLGVTLYRRRGRGLVLTEEGRRALAFGREVQERCRDFASELAGVEAVRPPSLALGEGALLYVVDQALRALVDAGAEVALQVRSGPAILAAVQEGAADLGVVAETAPSGSVGLQNALLAVSRSVVAVPGFHPWARRERLELEDLAEHPLIAPPAGAGLRDRVDAALAERGRRLQVAVEVQGWPATLHLVGLGIGPAVVNDVCRLPEGVVAVPLEGLRPVEYRLVRREGRSSAGAARLWDRLLG